MNFLVLLLFLMTGFVFALICYGKEMQLLIPMMVLALVCIGACLMVTAKKSGH